MGSCTRRGCIGVRLLLDHSVVIGAWTKETSSDSCSQSQIRLPAVQYSSGEFMLFQFYSSAVQYGFL